MKKFTAILLSMVMFVSVFAISPVSASAKSYENENYIYTIKDNQCQIIQYIGTSDVVEVPAEIDGCPVVKIGVDEGDKYYGDYELGFSFTSVKEVTVPDTVIEFGSGAFSNCKKLEKITLGKNIKELSSFLFYECKNLKEIKFHSKLEKIWDCVFKGCLSLQKIKLPSSITEIGIGAFSKTGLTEFKFEKNIKYIWFEVFEDTPIKKITVSKDNKKYSAKNSVLYNKDKSKLYCYPNKKKAKSFTIPKTVKTIDYKAFKGNKYLKSVVISNEVTKIDDMAFSNCTKLSKVTFKNKKNIKICDWAFSNCTSLKEVTIPKNVKKIGQMAFGFYDVKDKENEYKTKKIQGFTIKGKSGSQAQKYAKKHGFKFIAI
jgi:hypothetical protein